MVEWDPRTALIVVDVQNDFASPDGSLYVTGGEEVVAPINEEIDRAMRADAPVVYTQDWHPESTPHFEKDGGIWPVHCVAGTSGAELHPDLRVVGEIIRKGTEGEDGYSGFSVRDPRSGEESATRMESRLKDKGVERVVVVGLATDYCVKETALDAIERGFTTIVVQEATRPVEREPGDGQRALQAIRDAGGETV